MMMGPANRAPHNAQSQSLLEFLIVALDQLTQLGQIDQPFQWDIGRQIGEPVFCWLVLAFRPFGQ